MPPLFSAGPRRPSGFCFNLHPATLRLARENVFSATSSYPVDAFPKSTRYTLRASKASPLAVSTIWLYYGPVFLYFSDRNFPEIHNIFYPLHAMYSFRADLLFRRNVSRFDTCGGHCSPKLSHSPSMLPRMCRFRLLGHTG